MPIWMQLLRHVAIWNVRQRLVAAVIYAVRRGISFFICVE